jgi:hypothetical protein
MTEAAVETLRLTETTTPPPRLVLSRWGEPLPPPPPIALSLAQDDACPATIAAGAADEALVGAAAPFSLVHVPRNPNAANTNHAALMLLQLGADTPESDAAASVLAQLASKPAFYQLRTVEQLGYVVRSGVTYSDGLVGFKLGVQSPQMDPARLQVGSLSSHVPCSMDLSLCARRSRESSCRDVRRSGVGAGLAGLEAHAFHVARSLRSRRGCRSAWTRGLWHFGRSWRRLPLATRAKRRSQTI